MMETLSNKKILFFAPNFFGYEIEIQKTLNKMGALVDYFDERPKNDFITKASIRVNRNLILRKLKKYYDKINHKVAHKNYDFILVVGMEAMLPYALKEIKKNHPNAIFILYMWDSLQNKKYAIECLPLFDYMYSFDKYDVERFPRIHFRPLFFIEDYRLIGNTPDSELKTDLCFIGTVHSDRYNLIKAIEKQIFSFGLNSNLYMYIPNPKLFLYKKITDSKFRNAQFKEFNFKSLSHQTIISLIKESRVVLDIQHPSQTGLTMRTIEMLGANKKLITTNIDIMNYDFFDESNIHILDRNNPVVSKSFFLSPYIKIDQQIVQRYSIESWILDLFSIS